MSWQVYKACITLFIASFCTMVIELVAGRILAPYVGNSLYTWTSIIGVILAGISLGALLGGMLADRFPRHGTLGWLLLLAGLSALSIAPLADYAGTYAGGLFMKEGRAYVPLLSEFMNPLMSRILMLTVVIFLMPAVLLGMISPLVVRLAMTNVETTGNTVGRIYAFSTLGSILGTFATGFYLIELMGTRTILYAVGAVLLCCAPIFGGVLAGKKGRGAVVAGCLAGLALAWGSLWTFRATIARQPGLDESYYLFKESSYYTIKVIDDFNHAEPLRTLVLDNLIHSYTHVDDPFYLQYEYLRIYEELVAWRMSKKECNDFFFVGGGGYTLPRFFDAKYPKARVDVVEIDPWVTAIARSELGVEGTRIRSFNEDGRWFIMNREDQYDFIFGDAFNDLSIPYHLTTKEFDDHLKRLLKPDGLLMCLVIDSIKNGEFIPSYLRTLQASFGDDNVHLITLRTAYPPVDLDAIGTTTAIVVASQQPLDWGDFERFIETRLRRRQSILSAGWMLSAPTGPVGLFPAGAQLTMNAAYQAEPGSHAAPMPAIWLGTTSVVTPPERLKRYLAERKRKPVVLTDDYVPADNLIAPTFDERFSYRKR